MARARVELRSLTGLRFVAALLVLGYHALFSFPSAPPRLTPGIVRSVLGSGHVGVNLFFVLSGFVLAYTYVDREAMTTTARAFWRARFARVYPMHLVGLLAAAPLYVMAWRANRAHDAQIARELARQLAVTGALVQAWIPADAFDLNGPSWSLSVEAFFYACFPLLARVLVRMRTPALGGLLAVAWVGALAPAVVVGSKATGIASASPVDLIVLLDPVARLPDFVIGAATGMIFVRRTRPGRGSGVWPLLSVTCGVAVIAVLACSERLPWMALHVGLLDPLWALLLFSLACTDDGPAEGRAGGGLGSAPLVLLGRASYSLYAIHKPLYYWLVRWAGAGHPSWGFVAAYVATSIALSVALWWGYEEPMRRWIAPKPR